MPKGPTERLSLRKDGRYYKKVRGRVHYLGYDATEAMNEWMRIRTDVLAGREPPREAFGDGPSLSHLCNKFLAQWEADARDGAITADTWRAYFGATKLLTKTLGRNRPAAGLKQDDFARVMNKLGHRTRRTRSWYATLIRTIFTWGASEDIIPAIPKFGHSFKRRRQKETRVLGIVKPKGLIPAEDIRKMIDNAPPELKAMILLGINCAFGNTDCARLPKSCVSLDLGLIEFNRVKNSEARLAVLWPETVAALRLVWDKKRKPKKPEDADLVFLTRNGRRWVRATLPGDEACTDNAITKAVSRLRAELKIQKFTFYELRHTFRTVADSVGDRPATLAIMGHRGDGMDAFYVHLDDPVIREATLARLRKIADHVHAWLTHTASLAPIPKPDAGAGARPSEPSAATRGKRRGRKVSPATAGA